MRAEHVVLRGTFGLDGETFDVDDNVRAIGDDDQVLGVDAAHDAVAIERAVAGRHVTAVVCNQPHDDHVDTAAELCVATGAPVLLHPDDNELRSHAHPGHKPDGKLSEGRVTAVADVEPPVLHILRHTRDSCCLDVRSAGAVLTTDTLFHGGPGATGRSYSDRPTMEASLRTRLLTLPGLAVVHTGHGQDTTVTAERPGIPTA